jgi:hypothetical protein
LVAAAKARKKEKNAPIRVPTQAIHNDSINFGRALSTTSGLTSGGNIAVNIAHMSAGADLTCSQEICNPNADQTTGMTMATAMPQRASRGARGCLGRREARSGVTVAAVKPNVS